MVQLWILFCTLIRNLPVVLYSRLAIGKLNAKSAPLLSTLLTAHIFPPRASSIPFEINSPRPVPLSDLVVNFVKGLGNISGSIPLPCPLY